MLLIREVMHCKPGKVKALLDKFKAMAKLSEKKGWPKMKIMTDVSAERYWTLVAEFEVESMEAFMKMGESEADGKEMDQAMSGYHELVDCGRREIYRVEGA